MPWASVRENVRLPLKLAQATADGSQRPHRFWPLTQMGLAEFARRLPPRIVGRHEDAGLAGPRALVTDPDILLMDETLRRPRRDHSLPAEQ